jgi:2-isopropylmalate synthase
VVQPNKAVVGANAFAHASGIHQDGVLKARDTYEIMRAEDVGWAANKIVLGKLGPQRLQAAPAGAGRGCRVEADLNAAFARFKDLADRKSEIFDEDIIALVGDSRAAEPEHYRFVSLSQHSETGERRRHVSCLRSGAKRWSRATAMARWMPRSRRSSPGPKRCRDGAVFGQRHHLGQHRIAGRGDVPPAVGGRIVNGVGADPDIVVASAKAYLSALNKLHAGVERVPAQGCSSALEKDVQVGVLHVFFIAPQGSSGR